MFCAQCGKRMPAGAKFCPACGAPVADVGATPPAPNESVAAQPLTRPATASPTPADAQNRSAALTKVANYLVGPLIMFGFAALVELSQVSKGNPYGFVGFLFNVGLAVVLYAAGFQGLRQGKVEQAKIVSGVLLAIAALSAVLAFNGGDALGFGIDLGVAAGLCIFLFLTAASKL